MSAMSIIIISLVVSAFFAGIEIAFISSNKLLIELKSKQENFAAKILSPFIKNPSNFISTTLVGNTIGLVVYGVYLAASIKPYIIDAVPMANESTLLLVVIQTLISTVIVLLTAEFLPKVLFRINPDLLLRWLAIPFIVSYYMLWPLVHVINWLARVCLKNLFQVKFAENTLVFNKLDLDQYVSESVEDIEEHADVDTEIFKNALDFGNVKLRNCMTPRTELVSVDINASIEELYKKFVETGLSKILVHSGSVDHIIGYVHQKDLFKKPHSVKSILLPIEIAPETMPANELLDVFTKTHKSVALVVDELGVTAGIVTIEDIMEEIFGEIEDEHDVEQLTEVQLSETEFLFNARLEVDYLNNKYELNIPEGEYNTLGGFIYAKHENIPTKNEVITINHFEFNIISVTQNRINEVRLKINPVFIN